MYVWQPWQDYKYGYDDSSYLLIIYLLINILLFKRIITSNLIDSLDAHDNKDSSHEDKVSSHEDKDLKLSLRTGTKDND